MKISNENIVANVFASILFLAGILILLKIGFVNWILWSSILFFFIAKDQKFINSINPKYELKNLSLYFLLWFVAILMPITVFLMWLSVKTSNYRSIDDDEE